MLDTLIVTKMEHLGLKLIKDKASQEANLDYISYPLLHIKLS